MKHSQTAPGRPQSPRSEPLLHPPARTWSTNSTVSRETPDSPPRRVVCAAVLCIFLARMGPGPTVCGRTSCSVRTGVVGWIPSGQSPRPIRPSGRQCLSGRRARPDLPCQSPPAGCMGPSVRRIETTGSTWFAPGSPAVRGADPIGNDCATLFHVKHSRKEAASRSRGAIGAPWSRPDRADALSVPRRIPPDEVKSSISRQSRNPIGHFGAFPGRMGRSASCRGG